MGLTTDQQKRCDEIVERALALDVSLRAVFVMEACDGDVELRLEAAEMLTIDPRRTAIFEVSPGACIAPPKFGRYQTEELIGSGGMSVVYRALDPVINRKVAVKVMAQRMEASPGEYQRFLSELHLLGSLGHPNIVQVFDAGDHEGSPFIVMEYLEGENLAEAITRGHCGDFALKLSIARQVAEALQRVHAAAVCHRDVKPANVFLEPGGRAKLMDFGVSARLDGPRLTQSGALIGTLPYLAPEQIRGEKLGPPVDIYAFGVLLFELFTGSKPFSGTTAELLYQIAHTPTPLAPLAGLPVSLVDLIRSATAKDPKGRPDDFGQILQVIGRISLEGDGRRTSHNKWRRAAIAAGAAVIAIAAGWIWTAPGRRPASTAAPATAAAASPNAVDAALVEKPVVRETPPPASPPPNSLPDESRRTSPSLPGSAPESLRQPDDHPVSVSTQPPERLPEARVPAAAPSQEASSHTAPQVEPPQTTGVGPPAGAAAVNPPDITAPAEANAGANDSASKKEPLTEKPAAAPTPAVNPQNAADSQKIRDVIKRYAAGYRMMQVDEIRAVFPEMPAADQKTLSYSFSSTKIEDYRLEPQSDPEIEGDKAVVRCERSLSWVPIARTALQKRPQASITRTGIVTVQLTRKSGTWKIAGIKELRLE